MIDYDPYLLPDANVLDNCFGEKNASALRDYETFFSGLRICELIEIPVTTPLNYSYLKHIHAYIFQDIYPEWAGTTRTINLFKREKLLNGDSVKYTRAGDGGSNVEKFSTQLFQELKRGNYLQGLDRSEFCKNLANFMSRIWQIHPFREGNTRSIMVVCYDISRFAGYPLSLRFIDKNHKRFRNSLVLSTVGKPENLIRLLLKAVMHESRHKPDR